MIRNAIAKLAEGKDLSEEESAGTIKEILEGKGTSAQIGRNGRRFARVCDLDGAAAVQRER